MRLPASLHPVLATLYIALACTPLSIFVHAQSTPSASATQSASSSLSLTTSNFTTTITSVAGQNTRILTSVLPTTITLTPTTTANATAATNTSTPSATPISLDTRIDPGFGVLGVILILTGLPSTFWGHKNRWSSFFLIGFYSFALACLALILKFGVLEAINPPSEALRGVFVLACCIAGFGGGGVAIFFWKQAKYFVGAWGGFALALWIQCFRVGGLIRPIGFRWIMYIGVGTVGFTLCTIPRWHYHVLLASTAAVGATAFVLGIDCFTTANLKEFYIWNLGFDSLFPKFHNAGIHFPISQMMEVELGLIGAFTLMGAAVQLRILKILQFRLREIGKELRKHDEELEAQATARFAHTEKDLDEWEREHGRQDSHMSTLPLMKDSELGSPGTETPTLLGDPRRSRHLSGMSEFKVAVPVEDEFGRPRDRRQSIGAIPALDLGGDIESDIPKDFVAGDSEGSSRIKKGLSPEELEALKKKEELVAEINTIRKSIEHLRSATPGGSSISGEPRSRQQSFTSRRTLSLGMAEALEGPTRPPRSQDPRARVSSLDRLSHPMDAYLAGDAIDRPSSVPLNDEVSWNEYVRERKLFQPPGGVSNPIQPTSVRPKTPPIAVPNSVSEALLRRQQRESAIEIGDFGAPERIRNSSSRASSEDIPVALLKQQKSATVGARPAVTILPPRRPDPAAHASRPPPQRVYTFEELNERHREKLRDLQAPLSRAEREQAELEAARQRWERSKEIEKQVMSKKQAEKAAAAKQAEKRRHSNDDRGKNEGASAGHQRSLSADKLAKITGGSGSKRQSTLKVEDWMRFQQESSGAEGSRRSSDVPFPAANAGREPGHRPSGDRRKSSQML